MANGSSVARHAGVKKAETRPLNSLAAEINCNWQIVEEELSPVEESGNPVPVRSRLVFSIYHLVIAFSIGAGFVCLVWLAS